jgi:GTP-binding protein
MGQYKAIRKELEAYHPDLIKKPEIVIFTKMDVTEVREQAPQAEKLFKKAGIPVLEISAAKREGLKTVIEKTFELLT